MFIISLLLFLILLFRMLLEYYNYSKFNWLSIIILKPWIFSSFLHTVFYPYFYHLGCCSYFKLIWLSITISLLFYLVLTFVFLLLSVLFVIFSLFVSFILADISAFISAMFFLGVTVTWTSFLFSFPLKRVFSESSKSLL